ncbi:hypothetical protein Plec18170_000696 [Paecilomyces lecythidis]
MIEPGRQGSTITFNEDRIGKVTPDLGQCEGNIKLKTEELRTIFGIDPDRFGDLPRQFVIPRLGVKFDGDSWHTVEGDICIVEPLEWIPHVRNSSRFPLSEFETSITITEKTEESSKFTAGCAAELELQAGGSFYGVTASAKISSNVSFSTETNVNKQTVVETTGKLGKKAVNELEVFPLLKVKVVKKQRVWYRVDNHWKKLYWDDGFWSDEHAWWDRTAVSPGRIDRLIKNLARHPVPVDGYIADDPTCMLALPQADGQGNLDITTLFKLEHWDDWHVYRKHNWEAANETMKIAVPKGGAFPTMITWAPAD